MLIELIKPWRRWDAGFRLEKTRGAAEILVKRGVAKFVDDQVQNVTKPAIKKAPAKKAATQTPAAKKASTKKAATKKAAAKRVTTKKAL